MNKFANLILRNKYILAIVLLAAVLRFWNITTTPPALNWDEISHGYNAYSILQSGKDEWGETFPTIFRAYGDYKLPVYIYSVVPSVAVFGLNEFAVRLPSVLAGIGSVIFTYLLVGQLFSNTRRKCDIQLFSSLLMAIEPWSLFLSRGAFEANLAQFFVISGVYFFLRAVYPHGRNNVSPRDLIYSTALLGLSVWTYNSARVFVPLLIVSLIVIFRNELIKVAKTNKKPAAYSLVLIALFFIPMFYQLANPVGSARYTKVQILDEGTINQIVEGRNTSSLPPLLARGVHNKVTYFAKEFSFNYVSHFSPTYLFTTGGDQYQFSVPERGILSVVNLPFFYLGLVLLMKNLLSSKHDNIRRRNNWRLIFIWLLLAPIPSSLTREAPHVLRSITFLPVPMILTSYGFVRFLSLFKNRLTIDVKNLLSFIYIGLMFISLSVYLNEYFNDYRVTYSWSWQYGYKEAVQYTKEHYYKYDKIVVTKKYGEPHEFVLFYNAWDPELYRSDSNLVRFAQSDWFWVDAFDKYYFVNDWQVNEKGVGDYTFELESERVVDCSTDTCLLITSPDNVPEGWELLDTIEFLDGQTVFEIYEN